MYTEHCTESPQATRPQKLQTVFFCLIKSNFDCRSFPLNSPFFFVLYLFLLLCKLTALVWPIEGCTTYTICTSSESETERKCNLNLFECNNTNWFGSDLASNWFDGFSFILCKHFRPLTKLNWERYLRSEIELISTNAICKYEHAALGVVLQTMVWVYREFGSILFALLFSFTPNELLILFVHWIFKFKLWTHKTSAENAHWNWLNSTLECELMLNAGHWVDLSFGWAKVEISVFWFYGRINKDAALKPWWQTGYRLLIFWQACFPSIVYDHCHGDLVKPKVPGDESEFRYLLLGG